MIHVYFEVTSPFIAGDSVQGAIAVMQRVESRYAQGQEVHVGDIRWVPDEGRFIFCANWKGRVGDFAMKAVHNLVKMLNQGVTTFPVGAKGQYSTTAAEFRRAVAPA